jgi:tyrosyl-tRNA synthetase
VADWFAQLNNKMGGDLKKIQIVGQYMIEIWKAVGMERIGDKVYTGHNALGLFLLSN